MEQLAGLAQEGIDNLHKYGVKTMLALDNETVTIGSEAARKELAEYVPEKLTPEGEFAPDYMWFGGLDEANPEAMRFLETELSKVLRKLFRDVDYLMCEPERAFFYPYDYLKYPYYSKAALKSYRRFSGDPDAKFPTASTVPNTERTSNRPTGGDWKRYFAWRTKVHTDMFISWAKAHWNAFHDDPRYQGAVVIEKMGVALENEPHGIDLERLFASPCIEVFVPEYPTSAQDPYFKVWHQYARQYKKKVLNLFNVDQLYWDIQVKYWRTPEYMERIEKDMAAIEKRLIKRFLSAGVNIDADGFASCGTSIFNRFTYPDFGGKTRPIKHRLWTIWQALVRKYYNYGQMSLEEAERVLNERQKGETVAPNLEGKKRMHIVPARKIVIDGKGDEWDLASGETIREKDQAPGFEDWKGPKDLSCSFVVAADKGHVYLAANVTDDKVVLKGDLVPRPDNPWADEVNLYISITDLRKDATIQRGLNAYQLRFIPGEDRVWHSQVLPIPGSNAAWRKKKDGYFVEGRVPLSYLGFDPAPGMWIGLELHVIDADTKRGCRGSLFWNSKADNAERFWGIGVFGIRFPWALRGQHKR